MLRFILRGIARQDHRIFARKKSGVSKNHFFDSDIVYETEYFHKQDQQLLKSLKQKTLEEIKTMQNEIRNMELKIDDHNKNIKENLRLLKSLGNKETENKS